MLRLLENLDLVQPSNKDNEQVRLKKFLRLQIITEEFNKSRQGRQSALRTYRLLPNELKHADLSLLHFQYMFVDLFPIFFGKQLLVPFENSHYTPANVPVSKSKNNWVSHDINRQSENFREHVFCSIFRKERLQPKVNSAWWKFRVNSF